MRKTLHWMDENLEEFILVIFLIAMTLIMGIQVLCRYVLGMSLSWSEELTRYLFIWCGFLSVSYCSKKCLSIKIEQFVAIFPRRGKAIFKVVNHTFELIFFIYMIPFAWSYMMSSVHSGQLSPACGIPMYYIQAAPFVSFILVAFRVLQRWPGRARNEGSRARDARSACSGRSGDSPMTASTIPRKKAKNSEATAIRIVVSKPANRLGQHSTNKPT